MGLIKELKTFRFEVFLEELTMHCKAFEDNYGDIELARLMEIRPLTKKINVVFHHFREYVHRGLIYTHQVYTNDQCADIWDITLPQNLFKNHFK